MHQAAGPTPSSYARRHVAGNTSLQGATWQATPRCDPSWSGPMRLGSGSESGSSRRGSESGAGNTSIQGASLEQATPRSKGPDAPWLDAPWLSWSDPMRLGSDQLGAQPQPPANQRDDTGGILPIRRATRPPKWVMTILCPGMRESDFDPSDWAPLTLSDLGNCTVCLAPAVYPDIILPTTLLLPH